MRPGRKRAASCSGAFGEARPTLPAAVRRLSFTGQVRRAPGSHVPPRPGSLRVRLRADNLRAAVNLPGATFTGTAPIALACVQARLRPRAAVLPSAAPAAEKNAPGGCELDSPGHPPIQKETKSLFPLIWFYGDLMLTLNFECFLSYFNL